MRTKLAWGVSVAAFISIYFALDTLADFLGVPTYIDFGETVTVTRGSGRYSYDEEIDGQTTDVGFYILIASAMLAWRVFRSVISGKLLGDLKAEQKVTWSYWFAGLTTYILLTTPIWHIHIPSFLQRLLVLGIGIGVAIFFHKKYRTAMCEAREKSAASNAT